MKHALLLFIGLLYFSGNAQNLLVNGSAELVENSQIVGWTPTVGGNWLVSEYTVYPQIETATAGTQFFYPGYNYANVNGEQTCELSQIIDLFDDAATIDAGSQAYYFDGYTISFDQSPADQSNIFVDFLDASDAVLATNHFGPFAQTQTWLHLSETVIPPVNARKARVRLRSILINGSSLDGLYEDLYFGRNSLATQDLNRSSFVVYPNPTQNIVNIASDFPIDIVSISDMTGKIVLSGKPQNTAIDVSRLSSGMYLMTIESNGKRIQRKILKN